MDKPIDSSYIKLPPQTSPGQKSFRTPKKLTLLILVILLIVMGLVSYIQFSRQRQMQIIPTSSPQAEQQTYPQPVNLQNALVYGVKQKNILTFYQNDNSANSQVIYSTTLPADVPSFNGNFSPDKTKLAYALWNVQMYVYDFSTGTEKQFDMPITRAQGPTIFTWLPDNKTIFYISHPSGDSSDSTIHLLDTTSGSDQSLPETITEADNFLFKINPQNNKLYVLGSQICQPAEYFFVPTCFKLYTFDISTKKLSTILQIKDTSLTGTIISFDTTGQNLISSTDEQAVFNKEPPTGKIQMYNLINKSTTVLLQKKGMILSNAASINQNEILYKQLPYLGRNEAHMDSVPVKWFIYDLKDSTSKEVYEGTANLQITPINNSYGYYLSSKDSYELGLVNFAPKPHTVLLSVPLNTNDRFFVVPTQNLQP